MDLNQDVQEVRSCSAKGEAAGRGLPGRRGEAQQGHTGLARGSAPMGEKIAPFFTPTKIRLGIPAATPSLFKELLQCKHHSAAQHETLLGKGKAKSLIFSRTQPTRDISSSTRTFLTVWA